MTQNLITKEDLKILHHDMLRFFIDGSGSRHKIFFCPEMGKHGITTENMLKNNHNPNSLIIMFVDKHTDWDGNECHTNLKSTFGNNMVDTGQFIDF